MRWIALLSLAFALTLPAATSAKTITVDAKIVVKNGNRPNAPGNCSAQGFVMWEDEPGTVSATAHYTKRGEDLTDTATPPFHDTIQYVATYTVPAGHHWIAIQASGHRSGSTPSDCSDIADKIKPQLGTDPFVVLTVVETRACRRAKRELRVSKRRYEKLSLELSTAPLRHRAQVKKELKRAKRQRAKDKESVRKVC